MPRAMSLKQIQEEKLARRRTWYFGVMKKGGLQVGDKFIRFPKALDLGTAGGANLFDESEIDTFVEQFIAAAKALAAGSTGKRAARSERAVFVRREREEKRRREQAREAQHA